MIRDINKSISKAMSNVKTSFLGVISSILPTEGKIHAKAGADNEARDVIIITPYGYYSLPDKNLEAQVLFNNNARRTAMVGVNNFPIKPIELQINEVVIFNKKTKSYIHLKNDGSINMKAMGDLNLEATGNINLKGAQIHFNKG